MGTATRLGAAPGAWRGDAAHYRLDPPLGEHEHVIVSAVTLTGRNAALDLLMSELREPTCETYIFPATADGECVEMQELDGSMKGTLDHAVALAAAGYEVQA